MASRVSSSPVPCKCVPSATGAPRALKLSSRLPTARRQLLFLLAAAPTLGARSPASLAQDIPLFGLRKKLKKAEEDAEFLVKQSFETADKGIVAAEKGIEVVEKKIVAAEKGIMAAEKRIEVAEKKVAAAAEKMIEDEIGYSGASQAATVAGAEVVGILIATSLVNGILRPEARS